MNRQAAILLLIGFIVVVIAGSLLVSTGVTPTQIDGQPTFSEVPEPEFESVCGDAVCNGAEDTSTCSSDCGLPLSLYCGDAVCNGAEDALTCSLDCGNATVLTPSAVPAPTAPSN